jgi:hypothetical protein
VEESVPVVASADVSLEDAAEEAPVGEDAVDEEEIDDEVDIVAPVVSLVPLSSLQVQDAAAKRSAQALGRRGAIVEDPSGAGVRVGVGFGRISSDLVS